MKIKFKKKRRRNEIFTWGKISSVNFFLLFIKFSLNNQNNGTSNEY